MNEINKTTFAPQLYIKSGITDIDFYTKAFGAIEVMRLTNDDGSLHVAELSIDGMLFHLHEEKIKAGQFSPEHCKGITALIGLFVPDVDAVIARAVGCGCRGGFAGTGLRLWISSGRNPRSIWSCLDD